MVDISELEDDALFEQVGMGTSLRWEWEYKANNRTIRRNRGSPRLNSSAVNGNIPTLRRPCSNPDMSRLNGDIASLSVFPPVSIELLDR